MRFTTPVTCLDLSNTIQYNTIAIVSHTHLAAGSAEFTIKIAEIADSSKTYTLYGHEAPLLWVKFDPRGGTIGELMDKNYSIYVATYNMLEEFSKFRQAHLHVPLYCKFWWENFHQCDKDRHIFLYAIFNIGQKISMIKFLPMRAGGEISKKSFPGKIFTSKVCDGIRRVKSVGGRGCAIFACHVNLKPCPVFCS